MTIPSLLIQPVVFQKKKCRAVAFEAITIFTEAKR